MEPRRGENVRGPPAPTRGNFRVPRRVDTAQYQPQQVDRSQYYIPDPPPTTQPQYHYASQSHTSYFPPPPRAMHPPPPRAMIPPPSTRVQDYEGYQTAEIDLESFDPFDCSTNPPPPTRSRPPNSLPTDDEDDAIPDTQEVQIVEEVAPKRKYTRRADKKKWMQEEEVALAQVWIHISTCRVVGNEQGRDKFWERILEHFLKELDGTTRTKDSLNTKWSNMCTTISTFNGYFIQADGVRNSGCDNINVMTEALKDYKTRTGKEFTSIAAWKVVKDEAKWKETVQVGQTSSAHSDKRRKSSEGGNYESSSNNDDATVLPDLNESSTPSSRPRKGRKNVGSSSSKGGGYFSAFTEEYAEKKRQNMEEANMKKQALLDLQLEHQTTKTKRSDYKFFNTPHATSNPRSREWAIEQKREIAAKYGWEFNE
uniref:uncharacterized protein LOC122593770 n=1 Tax=Erigeron canadensis TaxID=72917 RepID=UPI001CB98768|nr:uncharacterized protein LOC122593770 [Erigeron canadensis]